MFESSSPFESEYSSHPPQNHLVGHSTRRSKVAFQTYQSQIIATKNRHSHSRSNRADGHHCHADLEFDHPVGSIATITRLKPMLLNEKHRDGNGPSSSRSTRREKNSSGDGQAISSASWSIVSEHPIDEERQQRLDMNEKISIHQSESSMSSSSDDELADDDATARRTYRLMTTDDQHAFHSKTRAPITEYAASPISPRKTTVHIVFRSPISSPDKSPPSPSSRRICPLVSTADSDTTTDRLCPPRSDHQEVKSTVVDIYILSDREDTVKTILRRDASPSSGQLSPTRPVQALAERTIQSTEVEEKSRGSESDDGWSDDSAELLYVDERYAAQNKKILSSTHLPSQHHHLQRSHLLRQE